MGERRQTRADEIAALQMAVALGTMIHLSPPFYDVLLYAMITATILSLCDYIWVGNQRLGSAA